jgi:hypothetical protein
MAASLISEVCDAIKLRSYEKVAELAEKYRGINILNSDPNAEDIWNTIYARFDLTMLKLIESTLPNFLVVKTIPEIECEYGEDEVSDEENEKEFLGYVFSHYPHLKTMNSVLTFMNLDYDIDFIIPRYFSDLPEVEFYNQALHDAENKYDVVRVKFFIENNLITSQEYLRTLAILMAAKLADH